MRTRKIILNIQTSYIIILPELETHMGKMNKPLSYYPTIRVRKGRCHLLSISPVIFFFHFISFALVALAFVGLEFPQLASAWNFLLNLGDEEVELSGDNSVALNAVLSQISDSSIIIEESMNDNVPHLVCFCLPRDLSHTSILYY